MEDNNMATQYGKTALQALKAFRSTKWFTKDFISLASDIAAKYASRNEVLFGGLLSVDSTGAQDLSFTQAAGEIMLAGKMHPFAAISVARDLHASNLVIFSDGADASSVTLTGAVGNYISIIACNSDSAGSVSAEGVAPVLVAVINGTDAATAAASTAPLTSAEIQAALEASSGVHDGVTGWVHIAHISGDVVNDGATLVSNLNNHLGL